MDKGALKDINNRELIFGDFSEMNVNTYKNGEKDNIYTLFYIYMGDYFLLINTDKRDNYNKIIIDKIDLFDTSDVLFTGNICNDVSSIHFFFKDISEEELFKRIKGYNE